MNKKIIIGYKLLRDLPDVNKGAIINPFYNFTENPAYTSYSWVLKVSGKNSDAYFWKSKQIKNPKWFKPIYE